MKVLLVNGSSRKEGCTGVALAEAGRALREEGVDTELFFIGNQGLPDCIACRKCRELGKCVFDDAVNVFVDKARQAELAAAGKTVLLAYGGGSVKKNGIYDEMASILR